MMEDADLIARLGVTPMDFDSGIGLFLLLLGGCVLILPVITFIRTQRIGLLEDRLERIESLLAARRRASHDTEPLIEDAPSREGTDAPASPPTAPRTPAGG